MDKVKYLGIWCPRYFGGTKRKESICLETRSREFLRVYTLLLKNWQSSFHRRFMACDGKGCIFKDGLVVWATAKEPGQARERDGRE